MNRMPKLSIITANLNNLNSLKKQQNVLISQITLNFDTPKSIFIKNLLLL